MRRERATKILSRILATIDSGAVPVRIDQVWVFGSYACGALEPNDLDLIIIHEKMSEPLLIQLQAEATAKQVEFPRSLDYPDQRYRGLITAPLRRPGERVDYLLGATIEEVLSGYPVVQRGPRIELWSPLSRDWRSAIAAIAINPDAQRAARRELIPCKLARCSLEEMRRLTAWTDSEVIAYRRIEPPQWPVELNAEYTRWVSHWMACRAMGKASLKCLPLGMWWLQTHGATQPQVMGSGVGDRALTRCVTFGALHPGRIAGFLHRPNAQAAAHVLHFGKTERPALLEFRRGPSWAKFDEIDRGAGLRSPTP